jgi:hypothetical protein
VLSGRSLHRRTRTEAGAPARTTVRGMRALTAVGHRPQFVKGRRCGRAAGGRDRRGRRPPGFQLGLGPARPLHSDRPVLPHVEGARVRLRDAVRRARRRDQPEHAVLLPLARLAGAQPRRAEVSLGLGRLGARRRVQSDISSPRSTAKREPLEPTVVDDGTIVSTGAILFAGSRIGAPRGRGRGGAILCLGIEVGEEAFVGAGAVVTKDVPSRVVVVGSPAQAIRRVTDDELLGG